MNKLMSSKGKIKNYYSLGLVFLLFFIFNILLTDQVKASYKSILIGGSSDYIGLGVSDQYTRLKIAPFNNMEGIKILSSNWSPFVIRDINDTRDIFRIDQNGNITGALGGNSTAWTKSGSYLYPTNSSDLIGVGKTPGYKLDVNGDIRGNTIRANGNNPFYFESWGGGWYMQDGSWIRTVNAKNVWTGGGLLGTDGGLTSGYGGAAPATGGAIISGNVGIGTNNPGGKLEVNGSIKQGSTYRKTISLPSPAANAGAGKWYIRLQPVSTVNLASVKITVNGSWNYAPIMGWLSAEYSYYSSGNGIINNGNFRVTSLTGDAASNLRLGPLEVENGYISIPVWCANTDSPQVTVEYDNNIIENNLTNTGWVSSTLPAANVQTVQSDFIVSGNTGIGTTIPGYKLDVRGTGSFSQPVIVGSPNTGNQAATKSYVDSAITGSVTTLNGIASDRFIYGSNGTGSNGAATTQNVYELSQYKSGFWDTVNASWTPTADWYWGATFAHQSNASNYNFSGQLIFKNSAGGNGVYARTISSGTPTSWSRMLSDTSDVNSSGNLQISGAGPHYISAGSVGIGTTNPVVSLHINGSVSGNSPAIYMNDINTSRGANQISSELIFGEWGINNAKIQSVRSSNWSGSGHFPAELVFSTRTFNYTGDVSERMRITSEGNVGIGTNNPGAYKLNVSGTGYFTDTLTINNSTADKTILSINGADSDKWIGFNGHGLHIGTDTYAHSYVYLGPKGSATGSLDSTVFVNWANATPVRYNRWMINANSADGSISGYATNGSTVNTYISAMGNSYFNVGNFGIGTTNPGAKLDVNGNARFYRDTTLTDEIGNIRLAAASDPSKALILGYSYTSDIAYIQPIHSGSTWVKNLAISPNGGNVGIGTTNPSQKLDVYSIIALQGKIAFDGSDVWLRLNNNNAFSGGIYAGTGILRTDGAFQVGGNGDKFIVSGNNVGIGSTNPGYNLDVNGTAGFTSINKIGPASNNPERGGWNPIWSAISAGRALYADEEFVSGSNGVNMYNNAGGAGVQHFWEAGDGSQPNSSGKWIRIVNNGDATSPGYGGFVQDLTCRRNATFVQRFRAKLPAGYNLNLAENSMGSNATSYWLTSTAGTGKWEEYIRVAHCGNTGTFSSGGHVYVTGGGSSSFTWYLASANTYEADSPQGVFSGNVGIGTTNSSGTYKLEVNGAIGASAFSYTSDRSLKKNITTIESPLSKILKLRGVTFNWKKDNSPSVGLIAQEVEKVFPELVTEGNGIKSVQYGNLVAPLIEAVKEQQKEIEGLNNRIKVLESNK
jgi:Chaperone of endosialidase